MSWTPEGRERAHAAIRQEAVKRAERARALKTLGQSVPEIAKALRVSEWTVLRDLKGRQP